MALAPAVGCIARPKETLRSRLSKCWYLQDWNGLGFTEQQLFDRIYLDALPRQGSQKQFSREEMEALRPYVLVWLDDGVEWGQSAAPNSYDTNGTLRARFAQNIPASQSNAPEEADRDLDNLLGLTIESGDPVKPGMVELSVSLGQIYQRMHAHNSVRTRDESQNDVGDAVHAIVDFEWRMIRS